MLFDVLKRAFRRPASGGSPAGGAANPEKPAGPPLLTHLEILFGDVRFGGQRFVDLLERSARDSGTEVYDHNLFRRAETGLNLTRYFLRSLGLDGARAECGVFRGMSSLLLCRAARAIDPAFGGARYYMVDSFERFSEPGQFDLVPTREADGSVRMDPPFPPHARLDTSVGHVRDLFAEFPLARIVQGYIPAAFGALPETPWAFVHVDVDLYEPTLRCLEYFFPRLVAGGIIVSDDYGSPRYPGARRAWDEYCGAHDVPFVTFACGQAVIIK